MFGSFRRQGFLSVVFFLLLCGTPLALQASDAFLNPPSGILSYFSWFTAVSSDEEAQAIFDQADECLLKDDYQHAASLFGRLASTYKSRAKEAHLKAGKAHLLNDDGERAIKWLTSYIKKYGSDFEGNKALGQAYGLVSDYGRQARYYERALQYDSDAALHFQLALVYDRLFRHNDTIRHAQLAVQLDPAYKMKLGPLIRNSNLSRDVGNIVDQVLRQTEDSQLTDEQINEYARRVGKILGEEPLK